MTESDKSKKLTKKKSDQLNQLFGNGGRSQFVDHERMSLGTLVHYAREKRWTRLVTDYTRSRSWSVEQKSKLIESFLINFPVPPIVLQAKDHSTLSTKLLIDGWERVEAIRGYLWGEYELQGLEYWPELNGLGRDALPSRIKYALDEKKVVVTSIFVDDNALAFSPDLIVKLTYQRLNSFRHLAEEDDINIEFAASPTIRNWIDREREKNLGVDETDGEVIDRKLSALIKIEQGGHQQ